VSNIFKAFTSSKGFLNAIYGWIFPAALVLAVSYLFAFWPAAPSLQTVVNLMSQQVLGGIVVLATVAGLILNALANPLYRFLQGYSWPLVFQQYGIGRQSRIKLKLWRRVRQLNGWRRQLILERLSRFPKNRRRMLPTSLGNAFRALETYAITRYGIDSQRLWSELCSVAPQTLQNDLADSRTGIDLFVATTYLSVISAPIMLCAGFILGWSIMPTAIFAVAALAVGYLSYRVAILMTDPLAQSVQAMVNLCRPQLASAFGLEMPSSLQDERMMWRYVNRLVRRNLTTAELPEFNKFLLAKQTFIAPRLATAKPAANRPVR